MSEDGQKLCTLNDDSGLEPAGEVEIVKGPKQLSAEDLKAYAKATGKAVLVLKEMSRRAILGELVQKLGAAKMGSSMLIDSEEMIRDGIKLCDQMMVDYADEPEIMSAVAKTRLGFVDLWVKVAQTHIKSRKDSGPDESDMKQQNVPFPAATTVQTNLQVNLVGAEKPAP